MSSTNVPGSAARRSGPSLRVIALTGVLVALIGAATARTWIARSANRIRLDDSEAALSALSDELKQTPKDRQLQALLYDAEHGGPGKRYAAVDALGEQTDPRAAEAIEHAFSDSSAPVRQRAMEVLQRVDRPRGLRLLLVGLVDEDQWIRQFAAQNLVLFCDKHPRVENRPTVPTLMRALDDHDDMVRYFAMHALCKATGNAWSYRAHATAGQQQAVRERWKKWWSAARSAWTVPQAYMSIAPVCPQRADPAPDFRFPDIDGHTRSLDGQRGRVTLLNFWGTWCGPCRVEAPDLARLDRAYRSRGLDVLGIALEQNSSVDELRSRCAALHVGYCQALADSAMLETYGDIHEVSVSFLLDRLGRIRYRWEGERDYETFSAAVEHVLAQQQ